MKHHNYASRNGAGKQLYGQPSAKRVAAKVKALMHKSN